MAVETRRPRIPSLVDGVDLRSLPLTPVEGFVLSRVDGSATVQDLADLTNLDLTEVDRIVGKLIELGAATWADGAVSLPSPSRRPSLAPDTPRRPAFATPVPHAPPAPKVIASESPPPLTTREPLPPLTTRELTARRRPSQPYVEVYSAPPTDVVEGAQGDALSSRIATGVRIGVDASRSSPGKTPSPAAPAIPPPPPSGTDEDEKLELIPDPSTVDALAGIDPAFLEQMLAEVEAAREADAKPAAPETGGAAKAEPMAKTEPAQRPAPDSQPSQEKAEAKPEPEAESVPTRIEVAKGASSETANDVTADANAGPSADADAPGDSGADAPRDSDDDANAEDDKSESAPADGIELAPERRKKIDDLFLVLELLDHYEVLGLKRNADKAAVRKAYFSNSKVFHPDTVFRKNLGAYKAKMEAIFSRLTEAYDVLGKKKARAEYDAYLASQGLTRTMEEAASVAELEIPPELAGEEPPALSTAPSAAPPAEPERERSEDAKRTARALMQKRLAGVRQMSSPRASRPNATSTGAARSREEVVRELARSLKGASTHTGGVGKLQRTLMDVRQAETAGDLAGSVRHLRLAVAMAPDEPEIVDRYRKAARELAAQLAERYEQQAKYEERHRKWEAAALSWGKVVEGRPDDAKAHIHAARALVEAGGDLHLAATLGLRAVELTPNDAIAHRVLGRVYVAAGLTLNARRELERAASLDPTDELVKNLLRDLAKS